jgi:hypothetical protein
MNSWAIAASTLGGGRKLKFYSSNLFSRSEFEITDTELKVIAALAIMGLSRTPKNG